MAPKVKSIIQAEELKAILNQPGLILLDARAGANAWESYKTAHIKNARFIDLDRDLAAVPNNPANGGRHPLPSLFDFAKTLSDLGISEDSHIVVYDDKGGANAAARCWWLHKAYGIEKVQVVDGGYQALQNFEISSGEEHIHASTIRIPNQWVLPTVNIQQVENELQEKKSVVIDVRDAYRYKGESEPIDPIAGHIPGAINIPLTDNLDENGRFLEPEILKEKYQTFALENSEQPIIHCGSGVTACHTILAMDYAGLPIPRLYVGSWSEWCRSGKTIAVGED
ncbi:MAG: sulfurtransferase [Bacteroidetes bacterium]|nr:sulfurtransferase [Bacteroidota bacterium]